MSDLLQKQLGGNGWEQSRNKLNCKLITVDTGVRDHSILCMSIISHNKASIKKRLYISIILQFLKSYIFHFSWYQDTMNP